MGIASDRSALDAIAQAQLMRDGSASASELA
jgi:hypothetical protein